MANCHDLFVEFDSSQIQLTKDRRKKLLASRDSLNERIKTYYKENKLDDVELTCVEQGSFVTDVIVNPIPVEERGETKLKYDLDYGVYFVGNQNATERKSIETYHDLIYEAVKDQTGQVVRKNTCLRVVYSDGHHIDLPIYYKQGTIPELAHKKDGWIQSDPVGFVNWFNEIAKINPQLKRLVRYMKAWCDNKTSSTKMPSGLIVTILTSNNAKYNTRDDIAMRDTLEAISAYFKSVGVRCERPTTPIGEDLFHDYSQTEKDYFVEQLDNLIISAKQAIEEPNQKDACLKWQKHFGDRFPCHLAKDEVEGAKVYSAPAIITSDAKSA
ncbi:MAG: cyclic GMP-AMP synthase DncV-like nucleotidyltransferase [Sedimentisphaerales bacterium]|jgi:hypothetical protein